MTPHNTSIWALLFLGHALAAAATHHCFPEEDVASKTQHTIGDLSAASTNFAYDLFKKVVQSPSNPTGSGNVFISPISVWSVLSICYLGAQGQTKKELAVGLGIDKFEQATVADLLPKFQQVLLHNGTRRVKYTFKMANKLYFDSNAQLKECVAQRLDAELEKADFRSVPEASRKLINKYVKRQTNNKIVDLIPRKLINSNSVMVIVNAAFFKGAWAERFMRFDTTDGDFFVEPNKPKKTKMMMQSYVFLTTQDPELGCSAIELNYAGNKTSMLILLPDSHNVQDLILKLTKEKVDGLVDKLTPSWLDLTMPKFKLEQEMDLKNIMKAMGVKDLFDPRKADLTGFISSRNVSASFIRHKTYVEVNEFGTVAATSAAVDIMYTSGRWPAPEFKINRPFVFLLRNKELNAITFIGLIADPIPLRNKS